MKYLRKSKTISGRLHDELVMLDIDQGKYFSLNPVAARIWDMLERPRTAEELCNRLTDEYEVEIKECIADVEDLLDEMVKLGLILKDKA